MDEEEGFTNLKQQTTKNEALPKWKKQLIIGGVIGLFVIILLIIIIVAATSGDNDDDKDKDKPSPNPPETKGQFDCSYEIEDISKETPILSKEYKKTSNFDIIIDSKKVDYSTEYKFNKTGTHNIQFILYEDINMDFMFKDIKELISIDLFCDKNA